MGSFTGSGYIEPDIYIQIKDNVPALAPAGAFVTAVVGLGKKTLSTSQSLVKQAGNENSLTNQGLFIDRVYNPLTNETYDVTTDYTFDSVNNRITWVIPPTTGAAYQVDYTYSKTDTDYEPTLYSDQDVIADVYGENAMPTIALSGTFIDVSATTVQISTTTAVVTDALAGDYLKVTSGTGEGQIRVVKSNTSGTSPIITIAEAWDVNPALSSTYQITNITNNTITIGSKVANENGGTYFLCVQAKDDTVQAFKDAIDSLKSEDCDVVLLMRSGGVVMGVVDEVVLYLNTHVTQMYSVLEKRERVGLAGGPVGLTSAADFKLVASGIDNRNMTYMVPSEATRTFGNAGVQLDGAYLAAAFAGIVASTPTGSNLSGKPITGFTYIKNKFTRSEMNDMAGSGLTIIENQDGTYRVRHALSTDMTNVATQEFKVSLTNMWLAKLLRRNLRSAFVNTPNFGTEVMTQISMNVKLLLESAVIAKAIVSYEQPKITTNSTDPREIDIKFMYSPVFDINYMYVTFGTSISF